MILPQPDSPTSAKVSPRSMVERQPVDRAHEAGVGIELGLEALDREHGERRSPVARDDGAGAACRPAGPRLRPPDAERAGARIEGVAHGVGEQVAASTSVTMKPNAAANVHHTTGSRLISLRARLIMPPKLFIDGSTPTPTYDSTAS